MSYTPKSKLASTRQDHRIKTSVATELPRTAEDVEVPELLAEVPRISAPARHGCEAYLDECQRLDVVPVSYFVKHLNESVVSFKHRLLADNGTVALARLLEVNNVITELDLSDNWIGDVGARALADALQLNQMLAKVDLSHNRLGLEGGRAMAEFIETNEHVQELALAANYLDDRVAPHFARALAVPSKRPVLQRLDLSSNSFGEKGGIFLGQALALNHELTELDLSRNSIRMKGAVAIMRGLRDNQHLVKVSLSHNGFDADSGKILAEVIESNTCLQELDLSHNRLNDEAARAFAKSISSVSSRTQSSRLRVINLSDNLISIEAVAGIRDALRENTSIESVILHNTANNVAQSLPREKMEELHRRIAEEPRIMYESGVAASRNL
eukprot:TRINITY_DN4080_c0_g1_i2.p1 TRINITY_DN4080_c0_g1~~TRINITY_DN4080_c0_g1_i2.p1  ORF type:complete len:385 (+),score=-21.42 TRINITY_DN4080_c0_g1_i2:158-1312(+)